MKIIGVDNLARETVADTLWLDSIEDDVHGIARGLAQRICDRLNQSFPDDGSGPFFTIKEDNYRLRRGMEDLV